MQRIGTGIITILLLLLFVSGALGALPQTINYQGYLKNSDGTPVNSAVSVVFSLYLVPSSGAVQWTETRSVTPSNGVYSVQLGSVAPLAPSLFANDTLYLGIRVGADPEMTPRQQLTMTPYAYRAGTADSVAAAQVTGVLPVSKGGTGSATQNFVDLTTTQTVGGTKSFSNTISGNISGNAATATTAATFTGTLAGDVTGTQGSTTVTKIQGRPVSSTIPAMNQVMLFNGVNWEPANGTWAASGDNSDITSLTGLNTQNGVQLGPYGESAGKTGELRFLELTANGGNYVGLKAADMIAANVIWTLPATDGSNGQMLTTNGANTLSWATPVSGTVTSVSASPPLSVTSGTTTPAISLGIVGIANGGTGSSTQTFVDLSSTQTIAGTKTFSSPINGNITGNAATATNATNAVNATNAATAAAVPFIINNLSFSNFFAGTGAGVNTTGHWNTAVGVNALYANITGVNNTAVGDASLNLNAGNDNTAVGDFALKNNTTGNNNIAVGHYALLDNTTASNNTALGTDALQAQSYNPGGTWDSDNTAVGYQSLNNNAPTSTFTGVDNTAVGSESMFSNTTGSYNSAIGYQVLYDNTTGYWNTASGNQALSNNTTGYINTGIGAGSLGNNTTGYYNTAVGGGTGYSIETGAYNTFIGAFADADGDYSNATAIGYGATVTASNMVRIGNTSVTIIEGKVPFTSPSDIRIKKDVEDIGQGLDFIKALRPVQYRLKDGNERIDFGFIAQDIETLLGADYNVLGIGGDADRTLSLRYTDFIAPMVKAMQEQQVMIDQLKAEISELKRLLGK